MSRIFWDTNLFIYLFEDFGPLSRKVFEIRERMLERGDQLVTSAMTLGELLVKPAEKKDEGLIKKYESAVTSTAVVVPFDTQVARIYAAIRGDRAIRPPDAIQLACAVRESVDLFITNDERLANKFFPGIQFILPMKAVIL
ncbi:MAG TPA: type II toxin-antitoxin system VapC family toxin [Candidatus Acidoferrales bacterium]|nr:type II toxin-antitoxin system VapC family toxin [Candidatus Acidoferrales bacterium]